MCICIYILLQTPLKVPYFEKYCSLNKKEPVEGLLTNFIDPQISNSYHVKKLVNNMY